MRSKERLRDVVNELRDMMYKKDQFPSASWEQRYSFLTRLSVRLQEDLKDEHHAQVMEEINVVRQEKLEEYQERVEIDRKNKEYNERIKRTKRGRG